MQKGLDLKSQAACAQGDIARYFDSLPILTIVRWLEARGVERALLSAVERLQLFTQLVICRSGHSFSIEGRTSGGLTGSTVALTLARIPVELAILEVLPLCFCRGFSVGKGRLVFGAWVDNIYAAAHNPQDACDSLVSVFDVLKSKWSLDLKENSGQVIFCDGLDVSDCVFPDCIKLVRMFSI